jgi:hypothetical protein
MSCVYIGWLLAGSGWNWFLVVLMLFNWFLVGLMLSAISTTKNQFHSYPASGQPTLIRDTYQVLYIQKSTSWWWAVNLLRTCRGWLSKWIESKIMHPVGSYCTNISWCMVHKILNMFVMFCFAPQVRLGCMCQWTPRTGTWLNSIVN